MSDPNLGELAPPASAAATTPLSQSQTPDGPTMTTAETLTGIFFEPGRVFESFRARPRFLVAAIITAVLVCIFTIALFQRAGYENMMRAAIENSRQADQMTPEQKDKAIAMYSNPAVKAINYLSPLIVITMIFAAGAALYMLGVMLMGRSLSYAQALSVWTYSSFPPAVLSILVSFILLFLKSQEDLETIQPGRSLAQANLGILVDPKASPVLAAALGSFDVFVFYGLFLAALGLRKVARLSSGAAWGIVLGLWLVGMICKVALAAATGTVMGG
jgi:hypothetical protein